MATKNIDPESIVPEPVKRPLHVAARGMDPAKVAAAKALMRWDDLFDVSDADLEDALRKVQNIQIGR